MYQLRRNALRLLASPSPFISKPRALSSFASSLTRSSRPVAQSLSFQRRWATSDAAKQQEGDEEVPISEIQPTAQDEVENAIHEDHAAASGEAEAPIEAAANTAPRGDASFSDSAASAAAAAAAAPTPRRPASGDRGFAGPAEPKPAVYVGNLFFDLTENDLQRTFSQFGTVTRARILRDVRGLSKGFGYVDFDTVEAATAAIEAMHNQIYEGRQAIVQYARFSSSEIEAKQSTDAKPRNPPSKTLFIGNLSFEMTDRDMNALFKGIRNVIDVRVAIDRRTGQARGFAHADFIDVKSAMDALKILETKETYGRKLKIDFSYGPSTAPRNQMPPE